MDSWHTAGAGTRAKRDAELLQRPELRSLRLQLEYLRAELGLGDRGILHSIVVFGSTRLLAPEVAREGLEQARRAAASAGADPELRAALRAAEHRLERSRYYDIARELGRIVGCCGEGPEDDRLAIVTGGGPGAMEAANRGASEAGAASVGLNIALPLEQEPNRFITPGLCFEFRYFALRKLHFMLRARALVALPGGYGTLDEVFETLCLIQTGKRQALPVVLIGESFWRRAVDFGYLLEEGVIGTSDLDLFRFAESAPEAWEAILGWYAERGRSIFEEPADAGAEF